MAIGRPEAIDGTPRRGLTAKEGFLVSRGMAAKPAGEESLTRLLRLGDRGAAGLRPDQAIEEAVWSGRGTVRERRKWRPSRASKSASLQRSPASSPPGRPTLLHPGPFAANRRDRRSECSARRRDMIPLKQAPMTTALSGRASMHATTVHRSDMGRGDDRSPLR